MSNKANKEKARAIRFARMRAERDRQAIDKSIARHYGKQDHNARYGASMAFARAILREVQPAIDARERAEQYLFRDIGRVTKAMRLRQ